MQKIILGVLACVLAGCASSQPATPEPAAAAPVRLGNFSISLTVKDLAASREFYEKLGFRHDAEIKTQYGCAYARCDVAMRYRP